MDVNEIMPRQCLLTTILCALFLVMFTSQLTFTSPFASQSHRAQVTELSECLYVAEPGLLSAQIAEHCPDQQPGNDLICSVVCATSCSPSQANIIQPHSHLLLSGSANFGPFDTDKTLAVSFKPLLRPPIG